MCTHALQGPRAAPRSSACHVPVAPAPRRSATSLHRLHRARTRRTRGRSRAAGRAWRSAEASIRRSSSRRWCRSRSIAIEVTSEHRYSAGNESARALQSAIVASRLGVDLAAPRLAATVTPPASSSSAGRTYPNSAQRARGRPRSCQPAASARPSARSTHRAGSASAPRSQVAWNSPLHHPRWRDARRCTLAPAVLDRASALSSSRRHGSGRRSPRGPAAPSGPRGPDHRADQRA